MGANANFYTVLKEAKGEYVWLMGDDDHINPSSLSQILADIEKYQPGVMIGGTERDTQGKRVYLPKINEHLLSDQRILMDYDGFVLAGKMSVLIFSKEALESVLESGWKTIQSINTPWPHLIWLFKLLAKKYTILVLPYTTNYIVEKNRYNLLQCGVVRIEPDDVWLDLWIPRDDPRFIEDVTEMAVQVGQWWAGALDYYLDNPVEVATAMDVVRGDYSAACFAGRGPGEVFHGSRKLVGVTQWRVREGVFVATLLPRGTQGNLAHLVGSPEGLEAHLEGAGGASTLFDAAVLDFIAREVIDQAGGMTRRELHLVP